MTSYDVIVGTKISYRVEVEAESFDQAAEKALDYVKKNADIEGKLIEVTRNLMPGEMFNDIGSTVEIICANGQGMPS